MPKLGLFFIGAGGTTASLSIFTIALLKSKLLKCDKNFITALPCFKTIKFVEAVDIEMIGGVDIKNVVIQDRLEFIAKRDGLNFTQYLNHHEVKNILQQWNENFVIGITKKDLTNCKKAIEKIKKILDVFYSKSKVDELLVIYLSSAEEHREFLEKIELSQLKRMIGESSDILLPNVLYTYAVFDMGFPFINFTSCQANSLAALKELANRNKVAHCGRDGKTGETYIKSVLAPAFYARNFDVLLWESHNILGDNDGLTLKSKKLKKDKIEDKKLALSLLGKEVEHNVRIDYVKPLGDWKTAWNLVEWKGLLGLRMSLQFIWRGHDGFLAAPMIWDLIRFLEYAARSGAYGVQKHLSFFFKNPIDYDNYNALEQFEYLKSLVRK
jgi:myo-inositol-1-phosphate synthase